MAYRYLWTPLPIGPITTRNRIVFSAHLTNYARDGKPTDQHAAYYAARAAGGAGLIITEEHSTHPTDWPYEKLIHGFHRDVIPTGKANYHPNSLGGGCPFLASAERGGYTHVAEPVAGRKVRERSESFKDFYSQAALFLHSMSPPERSHIVKACQLELGKVTRKDSYWKIVE